MECDQRETILRLVRECRDKEDESMQSILGFEQQWRRLSSLYIQEAQLFRYNSLRGMIPLREKLRRRLLKFHPQLGPRQFDSRNKTK